MNRAATRYALPAAALLVLGVLVFYHGAALFLPESLIDDATVMVNSDRFWANLKSHGIAAAIRGDISMTERVYNPGFWILNAVSYALTRENPMLLHAFRLVLLAMVCCVLLLLPRLVQQDLPGRAWYSAPLGGLAAALMFATAECPDWHNFQGLQANWYRLHTTDSLLVSLAALHFVMLYLAPRRTGWRRWVWELLSAGAMCLAVTIKVTAVGYIAALVWGALLLLATGDTRRASWCRVAAYTCGLCLLYAPLLLAMRPGGRTGGYGTGYSLSLDQLHASYLVFKDMYWRTLGPILVATVLGATARLAHTWFVQRDLRGVIASNIAVIHLWSAALLATAVYLPWKGGMPRYMLPGLLPLCAAAGIEIACQIEWARTQGRVRGVPWFCAGVCAAMLLPVKLLLAVAAAIVAAQARLFGARRFVLFNSGVLAVGWAFFLVSGWLSNRAMQADMVAVEHAQAALLEETGTLLGRSTRVGFLGDVDDEHIGSICQLLKRRKGIIKPIPLVTGDGQTTGIDYLLFGEKLNTAVQPSAIASADVWKEFRGAAGIRSPLDFWEWRRSVWHRQFQPPWKTVALRNTWVILKLRR